MHRFSTQKNSNRRGHNTEFRTCASLPSIEEHPEPGLMKTCCSHEAVTRLSSQFIRSILRVGVEATIAPVHGCDDSLAIPCCDAIRSGGNNGRHFVLFRG